jgi:DNA polymerase V
MPDAFALVDRSPMVVPGDTLSFQLGECSLLGKLSKTGFITQDVETIDGGDVEGILMMGEVTATILAVYEPLGL